MTPPQPRKENWRRWKQVFDGRRRATWQSRGVVGLSPGGTAIEELAQQVLGDPHEATAESIVAIVQALDPTRIMGLSSDRKRLRYRLKVGLQGLLLRQFEHRIEARRDLDTDDLAFLRIGPAPEHDAKHVVMSQLTEEERAILDRCLNRAESSST